MKTILTTLLFLLTFSFITHSQEAKPGILLEPSTWEFERFELPPPFAPEITYKGVEEIRFAPGMFNKDSVNYFSYVFVAQIDKITSISQKDVQNYLLWYFKGLCTTTARDRKLVIDSTKITSAITGPGTFTKTAYKGTVNLFGVFADGAPVKLNMEIGVVNNRSTNKTFLVFLASPLEKDKRIWTELYNIGKSAIKNALKE